MSLPHLNFLIKKIKKNETTILIIIINFQLPSPSLNSSHTFLYAHRYTASTSFRVWKDTTVFIIMEVTPYIRQYNVTDYIGLLVMLGKFEVTELT